MVSQHARVEVQRWEESCRIKMIFKIASRSLAVTRKEGQTLTFRSRKEKGKILLDEKLRSDLEWRSWNYRKFYGSQVGTT